MIVDDDFIPKTRSELEQWMIEKNDGGYTWVYLERGKKTMIATTNTEKEIVEYAYNQIRKDIWSKSYIVG